MSHLDFKCPAGFAMVVSRSLETRESGKRHEAVRWRTQAWRTTNHTLEKTLVGLKKINLA
jgi:hypothetical protein